MPEPSDQLTLRFTPTRDGARIRWESVAGGTRTSSLVVPYASDVLPTVLKALDAAQRPGYPGVGPDVSPEEVQHLVRAGLWEADRVVPEVHRCVGQRLYAALIDDRDGELALRLARESARSQGKALTYVLRFPPEAVELAALPWEALWDQRQALLLSRGGRQLDALERYLDLDEALSPPLPASHTLHILALAPRAGIPPEVRDAERAARLQSWTILQDQGLLTWDELSPVTARTLDDRMRRGPTPDIIHYYGHGSYDHGQGSLVFDSEARGSRYELVSAGRLSALLGGIRLIMLFACQSAMVTDGLSTGLFTGVAPALSAVAEAVVAMQLTVRVTAATRFSEVFYGELARGQSVQAAVAEARRSLYVLESDGASWYVPTLYLRTREQRPLYLVQPVADERRHTSGDTLQPDVNPPDHQGSPIGDSSSPAAHPHGQPASPTGGGASPAAHPEEQPAAPTGSASSPAAHPEEQPAAPTGGASSPAATPQGHAMRQLTIQERGQLVELLLACPAMQDSHQRGSVLDFLEAHVRSAIPHHAQSRADVLSIVTTCNNYPGALDALLDGVRFFDGGTVAMQAVDDFWQQKR
ncbi:CHAT domain-containing protein [Candidatus Chloroploca sp. M-50]|uniref:CHAT domain-containing protein n=1 Tax=Candidatus Chloroploca mongolica TaxID=2528176 RepID=A0ABS4DFW7_9CHLR|nr:CHAT domain-containing protein [Candidatus Chloroploca mongolica]MBP1468312.1 CHAT domain-containing protein [Candidatus Chloroploca mongolica]